VFSHFRLSRPFATSMGRMPLSGASPRTCRIAVLSPAFSGNGLSKSPGFLSGTWGATTCANSSFISFLSAPISSTNLLCSAISLAICSKRFCFSAMRSLRNRTISASVAAAIAISEQNGMVPYSMPPQPYCNTYGAENG